MFKKQTHIDSLIKQIGKFKREEVQAAALELLGDEAKDWWEHRSQTNSILLPGGRWASQFEANGQVYYILKPEELSGKRYTKFRQIESAVGFDATLSSLLQSANRMSGYYNTLLTKEPKLHELGLEIANFQQALSKTDRNWDISLMAATLVICRKGSDKFDWNEHEAQEDLENWNKAGYPASDFFLLAMSYTTAWNGWFQKSLDMASKATIAHFGGI